MSSNTTNDTGIGSTGSTCNSPNDNDKKENQNARTTTKASSSSIDATTASLLEMANLNKKLNLSKIPNLNPTLNKTLYPNLKRKIPGIGNNMSTQWILGGLANLFSYLFL